MQVAKHFFCSSLFLISTLSLSLPDSSICGKIESGQLTIPSYRFDVVDKNGDHPANLTARGELDIAEGVWKGGLIDGHWEDQTHSISILLSYDPRQNLYVSQELPKVKIERRKKGLAPFKRNCWDRVARLVFTFKDPKGAESPKPIGGLGLFVFHFPNKRIKEISLPDPSVPIKLIRDR